MIKQFFRRFTKKTHKHSLFHLEKRERFIIVTVILTSGMLIASNLLGDTRLFAVVGLAVLCYPLSYWGLKEDIRGSEKLTLFILPVFYTLSVTLFYFLLPVRWLTRLPAAVLFAIGMYALLLSVNIFNVAANRSIQLLRAAQSVGFLMTLVIMFLSTNIVLSFRFPFYVNFVFVFLISFVLFFQFFWSSILEPKISKSLLLYSLGCALVVGEIALGLSFWPVRTTIAALFLTSVFYTLGGWIQQFFFDRLFDSTIKEYVWIPLVVFVLMFFVTQWS